MPTISDIALCVRRWDFSESSQTVSLFTREHGVIRGLAKGAKRPKGPFSGGIDVLTRGQVVAIVKPGRDLATLTEWHLQQSYRVLRERLDANRAGLYMADLICHMVTDQDPHPRVFETLEDSLERLVDPAAVPAALLALQWTLLDETGYRPQLDRDVRTGGDLPGDDRTLAFSPSAGGVLVPAGGRDEWPVRRSTIDLLQALASAEAVDRGDPSIIRRANRLLAAYCRELIGREPPAMAWAFSDLQV